MLTQTIFPRTLLFGQSTVAARAALLAALAGSVVAGSSLAQTSEISQPTTQPTTNDPAPTSVPSLGETVALPAPAPAPVSGFTPVAAPAGMVAIAPYYAFVSSSMPLRSGAAERFYSVATLQQGTVVIVDAQSQGWSRVAYPAGLAAFVRAEDANVVGSSVTLVNASRLRAASQVHGFGGSWQVLLDSELAAGSTLALIEPVKEGAMTVAYKVQPPSTARAFVFSTALRRATDAEIAAARAKDVNLPEATALAALSTAPALVARNEKTASGELAIDVPAGLIGKDRANPSDPVAIVQGGGTAGEKASERAGGATSENPAQTDKPVAIAEQLPVATKTTAEDLEPLFQRVKDQPILEGEIDELIAEYEQVQANFDDKTTERRRKAVSQRIEFLRVRADLRNTIRRQQDEIAKLDASKVQMQTQLDEWARTRYYTIVGVLQPSTVYDGGRLPQMYRVVSVGTTSPRTLGYIRKTEQMDLDRYLGQVVGVIGDRSIDRSLQLNLIDAIRVDPLRGVDETTPAPAAAPAATPAP